MRHWDSDGPAAPVDGVPEGCRAVRLVEVVERDGAPVEVRDRRRRHKTEAVVLVPDPDWPPPPPVPDAEVRFATGASRRRWQTVVSRHGEQAYDIAVQLVRARVVHLACDVDPRGRLGAPRWWQPTPEALAAATADRARRDARVGEEARSRARLAAELRVEHPELARALAEVQGDVARAVVVAAGRDVLAGVVHAGPRAFAQSHFGATKVHDVVAVLRGAGVPGTVVERLGLRRGDRIGLGGPVRITTRAGTVDLAPLRGPVVVRLDQPDLRAETSADALVVIENLQPAEAVCAAWPDLAVVYTAGQFGDDAAALIGGLARGVRRVVAIVDADLGGVRIARRVRVAVPHAEVVDVGDRPHREREPFEPDGSTVLGLRVLADDPLVGELARSVLARGHPVEQEVATLEIVREVVGPPHP